MLASLVFASAFDSAAGLATWWLAQTANEQTGPDQAAIHRRDRGPLDLRKEAERFMATEVNPSRDWDAARQTLADAFARWLETRQLKPRTREGYRQAASYALRS
jgi:hypothetical protein